MLKNIFSAFIELLQAVVEKVEEWSHEPLFWAYAIGTLFSFLMFSQGWWLAGWIVLALTMLVEKRNPTKRAPDAGDSAAISSSFTRLIIFLVGRRSRPRPSAGNANR